MSETNRAAANNAISELVAATVKSDHMTTNATPKATYKSITIDRVADVMEKIPYDRVFTGGAVQDAIDQATGIISKLTAIPHREASRDGTYTYTFTSDSKMKVSPDNTGWFFKNVAGSAVSYAFREAERATKDYAAYKARNLLEVEARSDTAEGIDGDRAQTQLAQMEERAITSMVSARLAWIIATRLSDWSAKVTDGNPAQGTERIAPQDGPAPKAGTRKSGVFDN